MRFTSVNRPDFKKRPFKLQSLRKGHSSMRNGLCRSLGPSQPVYKRCNWSGCPKVVWIHFLQKFRVQGFRSGRTVSAHFDRLFLSCACQPVMLLGPFPPGTQIRAIAMDWNSQKMTFSALFLVLFLTCVKNSICTEYTCYEYIHNKHTVYYCLKYTYLTTLTGTTSKSMSWQT